MIVRKRRKREKFLRKLAQSISRVKPPAGHNQIMSGERFQLEIDKEMLRSNRRSKDPEFAIVSLDFSDHDVTDEQLGKLINQFMDRVRLSDSIGWHRLKLAILLPETGHEGALLVCNSLLQIAMELGVEMDSSISIYPWDDVLHGPYNGGNRSLEKGSNGSEKNWGERSGTYETRSALNAHQSGGVAVLENFCFRRSSLELHLRLRRLPEVPCFSVRNAKGKMATSSTSTNSAPCALMLKIKKMTCANLASRMVQRSSSPTTHASLRSESTCGNPASMNCLSC